MEKSHLYVQTDALLMDAALKFSCYKEEDYCPIGLRKKVVSTFRFGRRSLGPHHRCQFRDFSLYIIGASLHMPPLRGLGFLVTCCYKHAIPTGFKRVLKSARFLCKIRSG